jgi:hypothetical protein
MPSRINVALIAETYVRSTCHTVVLPHTKTATTNTIAMRPKATRIPWNLSICLIRRISASAAIFARLAARISTPHVTNQGTQLPGQQHGDQWPIASSLPGIASTI